MSESRLFQIVYHLLIKGEATASELAEKFEVSTRTIYRDIDKLSGAGIPVYTAAGYKGGIRLTDGFVLEKSVLSKEDMQNILTGVQSLSAVCFPDTDSILSKLQALFQISGTDWMEVDYSRWGDGGRKERRTFTLLKNAIQEKYQVRFRYYGSNGEAENRTCLPLKLFYKDSAWYLSAHCLKRNAGRAFRLSRIRELQITEQHFESVPKEPAALPPKPYPMLQMELRFTKKAAHRVYDMFGEHTVTDTGDYLTVKAVMPEDEWMYGFLMSFGDGLTVLSPVHLKNELRKRFLAALRHFES